MMMMILLSLIVVVVIVVDGLSDCLTGVSKVQNESDGQVTAGYV